jgi:signal peptidase II
MVNTKSPRAIRWRRVALLGLVGSGSLACDLQTKAWAWDNLRDGATVSVVDPLLELVFAFNTGSAFSIIREGAWAHTMFVIVSFAALAWMVYAAATMSTARRTTFVGLGLIAAGTLGNLHDRLFRIDELGRHGVVDFMKINYPWGGSWPVFNVADVALLVGVAVLFIAGFGRQVEAAPPDPVAATG